MCILTKEKSVTAQLWRITQPNYCIWVCCSQTAKKTYLVKAEASINHAFIMMSETFLTWVTIVILPASFTPIFGIDLIIILPWVTNVLKSKKVLLVCCLLYSFKSAFGFLTISRHLFRFEPISWCLCFFDIISWHLTQQLHDSVDFVSNKLFYLSFQTNLILPLSQVG